jgi:hypothetical protein
LEEYTVMNSRLIAVVGLVLIVAAFFAARSIPREANKDFDKLVRESGGVMTHGAGFPDTYRQMSSNRRLLQNFYIGGAGLLCLAAGLVGMQRKEY